MRSCSDVNFIAISAASALRGPATFAAVTGAFPTPCAVHSSILRQLELSYTEACVPAYIRR